MGNALKLIRGIDKNLNVPAAQVLIEFQQYPLEAVEIALIGILNENEINIAFSSLPPPGEGPE